MITNDRLRNLKTNIDLYFKNLAYGYKILFKSEQNSKHYLSLTNVSGIVAFVDNEDQMIPKKSKYLSKNIELYFNNLKYGFDGTEHFLERYVNILGILSVWDDTIPDYYYDEIE